MDKSEELVIKYLGEIPIKFAEWIADKSLKCPYDQNGYIYFNNNGTIIAENTEELFKLFIEEEFSKQ